MSMNATAEIARCYWERGIYFQSGYLKETFEDWDQFD